MTENEAAAGGADQGQQQAMRLSVLTQYVKDLSFENPRAPMGLQPGQPRPEIQIAVDVNAQALGEGHFEVSLECKVDAKASDSTVFLMEVTYGAVFSLANIPNDSLQALLLIECPRLLFPFVRRIIADVTRDGGFPPLLLDPIDFVALYRRRLAQMSAAEGQNGSATA